MSKEAVVLAVDVGSAMDGAFSDGPTSRLALALECCKLTLQQKLFNNPSHQIGLVLFGDEESDDGNSLILQPIGKPSLDLVRKVEEMSKVTLGNPKQGGNTIEAIRFAAQAIVDHCGTKKYNKRIFLFTNGNGPSSHLKVIPSIAKQLKQHQIKLNIIPIDFMETYNIDNNELEGEGLTLSRQQEATAQSLIKLKEAAQGQVQIFPASLAIELYRKFRKRDVNPVALFKGALQIAPGLAIQVCSYKAIRRQRIKSLSRYDRTQEFDPIVSKQKEVINDVSYIVHGDDSGTLIPPEDMINAYNYGPQLVPISQILERGAKIHEDKNLKLLGFVDKSKIPRYCMMGQVDIVVPAADDAVSRKLFTSFVYSMITMSRYAVARYVPRNNKNGVNPRLVALIPYRSAEKEMFYLVELPTVEDVRDYPFNGLKKSTQGQQQIVRQLVDKMMLYTKDGEDEEELLRPDNLYNPSRQYFFQGLFHRATFPQGQLPSLDPVIRNYITPESKIYAQTAGLMGPLKKEFKLVKKEIKKETDAKKKAVVWKDIIEYQRKPADQLDTEVSQSEKRMEEMVEGLKKFSFGEQSDQSVFNAANPIHSFRQLINNNKADLVSYALKSFSSYIANRAKLSVGEADLNHLLQCCSQLRKGCLSEKEEEWWDSWLDAGEMGAKLREKLSREGLGYLRKKEEIKIQELHPLQVQEIDDLD